MTPYIDWTFIISLVLAMPAGLTGFWLWLRERRRTLPSAAAALEALREENALSQAQLEERLSAFEERIDFLEGRVVQFRDTPRLSHRSPATPV